MGRPKYIGIFLTPQSRRALLRTYPPVHPTVYADHVTVIYDPTDADLEKVELGEIVTVKPVAHLEDEKAQVLRVSIPSYLARLTNRVPHITISTARGVAPVYAGELAKSHHTMIAPKPGNYTGIVDVDKRSHPVRTRMFPLAAAPKHYKIDQGDVRKKTRRDKKQELEEAKDLGFYSYTVMKVVPIKQVKTPPVWNQGRIDRIKKGLASGKAFPPISLAGKRPPYEISDGIHRTNASIDAGYTHIPAYFTVLVERPDLYEEPEKEKPKLRPGTWVKMRASRDGFDWAVVIEYVGPRVWKGVKRHLYGLVAGDTNKSDFIGDWMDSEFDPVREGQVPRKVRETILADPFADHLPQRRVAARHLIARDYFEIGDIILYGKYKNKKARIVAWGKDHKGNPTVEIEPIPKGRKKNKTLGLFRIWHALPPEERKKEAQVRTAEFSPNWDWPNVLKNVAIFNQIHKTVKGWTRLSDKDRVPALQKEKPFIGQLKKDVAGGTFPGQWEAGLAEWLYQWWGFECPKKGTSDLLHHELSVLYRHVAIEPNNYLLKKDVENTARVLDTYSKEVNDCLKQAGPARLTYSGFKVWNPQRMPDKMMRKLLSGVDHIMAIFRKRGMEKALTKGVKDILVRKWTSNDGKYVAWYFSRERRIVLTDAVLKPGGGRLMDRWISEVFLHEFGHHVHMTYLHPNAKKEWDAGWSPVESAREKVEQEFKITGKDRRRFFDLIERNDWSPSKAARKLKGLDKLRFMAWLRNPGLGEPLITPKIVRLTRRGKDVFDFLRDPEGHWRQQHPGDLLSHLQYESKEQQRAEEDAYVAKQVAQKLRRLRNDVLSLDWEGADKIPRALQDEIRKEDKSVDAAIDALEVPTDYARTNEMEDFAESFVAFVANPAKLSDQAKFRMQRALSLSGLYGKPIMRLAERVAQTWRRRQAAA